MIARSPYGWIIHLFASKYSISPRGTGVPIGNVKRPDVIALHGPRSGRAATWYDEENGVCWLIAFSPEHDYSLFEERAAAGELLPSTDDYTVLFFERDTADFDRLFGPAVREMLKAATTMPGTPHRRTVRSQLEIEITVIDETFDSQTLHDVYLSVRVPPLTNWRPPGWPHHEIPRRLLELATRYPSSRLSLQDPETVPDSLGGWRRVEWDRELAAQACSLTFALGEPVRLLDDDGVEIEYEAG